MKKVKTGFILLAFAVSLAGCALAGKEKAKKVPYVLGANYYISNQVEDRVLFKPRITSESEFQQLFGMATLMGKKGKPTQIDFSKQYVIAYIDQSSSRQVNLKVQSLKQAGEKITLTVSKTVTGKEGTGIFRKCLIVIVDKKYTGEVVLVTTPAPKGAIPYTLANRYFVKNNVADGFCAYPALETEEAFSELFGMAPVMGEGGQPTAIDFGKQYVIAIVDSSTNVSPMNLELISIAETNGKLQVTYKRHPGTPSRSTFRYCTIAIVSRDYLGKETVFIEVEK